MAKDTKTTPAPAPAATPDPIGLYEIAVHDIEIDNLICYRTHRLRLTKSRAETINTLSPGALVLVGV